MSGSEDDEASKKNRVESSDDEGASDDGGDTDTMGVSPAFRARSMTQHYGESKRVGV